MKTLKLILGVVLLPFAYFLFVLDRIVCTLMPQMDHPKFNEWLNNANVIYAIIRVITFFTLQSIIKWIIGF